MSLTVKVLERSDNYILPAEHRRFGHNRTSRFVKHNKTLFVRKQKPFAAERKEAQNVDTLRTYFLRFKQTCRDIDLKKEDLFNMKETGFRIEREKTHTR